MPDDLITVAEFLEAELYSELAEHLGVRVSQLKYYKVWYPQDFREAACYVLKHVVTNECRLHIVERLERAALAS